MRTLGTRRVALLAGAATAAAVALAGCSAGQVAETSLKKPSNQGVNTQNASGSVLIRNLAVSYDKPEGYAAGASAPIEVNFFNQSKAPITVRVSSTAPAPGGPATVVTAAQVGLLGGASASASAAAPEPSASGSTSPSASASASAEPSAPAAQPAQITIPPMGTVSFLPGDTETLEAIGLNGKLAPGSQLSLLFEFSDGTADLPVLASVATPLTPAPRGSGNTAENSEE